MSGCSCAKDRAHAPGVHLIPSIPCEIFVLPAVLCVCVCSTCLLSWIMHRLDAKGRKLYMPGGEGTDEGAPDPHDDPLDDKLNLR